MSKKEGLYKPSKSRMERAQNAPDTKSRKMRNIHPYISGQAAHTTPKLNVKVPGDS